VDVRQRKMTANVSRTVFWSIVLMLAIAVALLGIEISGFRYLLSD
jgi:hypothetical protein